MRQLIRLIGQAGSAIGSLPVRAEVRRHGDRRPTRSAGSWRRTWCPTSTWRRTSRGGYRVCSLYLDTPQFSMYRQIVEGIRIATSCGFAFTTTLRTASRFLEIKKRTTETVHKLRAVVAEVGGGASSCAAGGSGRRICCRRATVGPCAGRVLRVPRSAERGGGGVRHLPARGVRVATAGRRAGDVRPAACRPRRPACAELAASGAGDARQRRTRSCWS